ncbi:MAG: aldo/keto reductase [Ruminococcaceae bacterium]|nr:aldo/keto reductase [Oscillospiraceae bacterium]
MVYRELGNTGKKVSIIGHGCENLDRKPYSQVEATVKTALDNGVNIFEMFMPGKEIRKNVAKALGGRRKDVFIQGHICSTDINQQYDISRDFETSKKYFEDCLRIFGGYLDFGMIFFIDSDKDFNAVFDNGIVEYMQKRKELGDIGHIGFSSHNPLVATKMIKTGIPELMLFSINLAFDLCPPDTYALGELGSDFNKVDFRGINPERTELYKLCERLGVGINVMKPLGAGKLLSPDHTPFSKPMTDIQCIHYALSRPAVSSVLVGCQTPGEVISSVKYLTASEEEKDYTFFLDEMENDFMGHCVYCNHCQPCPVEIDIAAVNRYLDIAKLNEADIPPSIISHYAELPAGGSACISCGSCESRCPFGVPIIENMAEAVRIFE